MKNFYFCLAALFIFSSCAQQRNLVYFSDLSERYKDNPALLTNIEPKINESDLLSITVNTPSIESNVLFAFNSSSNGNSGSFEKDGYRVNKNGEINFPVIGLIKLKGLTLEEAQNTISKKLEKYVTRSIVKVQFINFRITVIGEVNEPSSFTTNEEITLLEALGMAGDMTVYGRRENVLVIRKEDGRRTMARLNLNKQETLESPYFYLKQNDVVYVEPDKAKALEYSPNNRLMPLIVATISAVAVMATTLIDR